MHLTIRQNKCDYIIQNRDRFIDFMEDNVDVTEYISKMLLDGEWGCYVELVAFSEFYITKLLTKRSFVSNFVIAYRFKYLNQ